MPKRKMHGGRRRNEPVDDAEMKYVIVHLHKLLEPDLPGA